MSAVTHSEDEVLVTLRAQRAHLPEDPHLAYSTGERSGSRVMEDRLPKPDAAIADIVIDTSTLNVHQLTDKVAEAFGTTHTTSLKATVVSFGFKYGIPVDADLVADMRFLPNPHWVPELRHLSGRDGEVAEYVKSQPGAKEFAEQYVDLVELVAEGYLREGKRFMTVAIGCTGGKHRSVAMAEEIAAQMRARGLDTKPMHRDLGRE